MRTPHFLPILVVPVLVAILNPLSARADQAELEPQFEANKPTSKQYDKRLPPVLPGEEVVTEGGDRIKVWSSSGPVPVNPQPSPQVYNGNMPGLILDGRVLPPPPLEPQPNPRVRR